ncbi:hypothetical protein [Pontibacter mangrovi]|nr:hypothetical protein [Pontibacter mangrovi]
MLREYPPRYELWEFIASLTYDQVQHEYTGADVACPPLSKPNPL